jgi:hypothetical protein
LRQVTTGSDIFLGSGNASFAWFSSGGYCWYNSTYSVTGAIYIDGGLEI